MALSERVPRWYTPFLWVIYSAAVGPVLLVSFLAWAWRHTEPEWLLPTLLGAEVVVVLAVTAVGIRHRVAISACLYRLGGGFIAMCSLIVVVGSLMGLASPRVLHDPAPTKRVAVVGTGAAGSHAAWFLHKSGVDIDVYEAAERIGGHAISHKYTDDHGRSTRLDMGFVFGAPAVYQELKASLALHGVDRVPVTLDLSGHVGDTHWATGDSDLPDEVARFQSLAEASVDNVGLNYMPFWAWLDYHGFSNEFRKTYLTPLLIVLFITDKGLYQVSTRFVLTMMAGERRWLSYQEGARAWVMNGTSKVYYDRLTADFSDRIRLQTPVTRVERVAGGVKLTAEGPAGRIEEVYDDVVLAVPADVARLLVVDRGWFENYVLAQVRYTPVQMELHTDDSALPSDPERRRSYNYRAYADGSWEFSSMAMRAAGNSVDMQPVPIGTLNPQRAYSDVRFSRGMRHHSMDMWHLVNSLILLPSMQGNGGLHYAGDWVTFIGHGPAMRTGVHAACSIAGVVPAQPLSSEPCVDATLIDAIPSVGLAEERVSFCGEQGLYDELVRMACPDIALSGVP